MSRRYGRQQKRQARELIANLERAITMDAALIRQMRENLDTAEAVIDHARACLGHDVALPPVSAGNHPQPLGGDLRLPIVPRVLARFAEYGNEPTSLSMKVRQLHQLVGHVAENERALHFYLDLDDGSAAYAIDQRALSSMPHDLLVETLRGPIARELSMLLVDHFKKSRR